MRIEISDDNIKSVLEPFFEKFPLLKENYCAECLGLHEANNNSINNLNVNLMDTSRCSKCQSCKDLVNPLIYTLQHLAISKKSEIFEARIFNQNEKMFNKSIAQKDRLSIAGFDTMENLCKF